MNEARQIQSTPASAQPEPAVLGHGEEPEVSLPPIPTESLPEARLRTAELPLSELPRNLKLRGQSGRPRVRKAATVVLILFLVALVAFAAGVAIAYGVISGAFDAQTGWVKDVLGSFKDFAHHFSHK